MIRIGFEFRIHTASIAPPFSAAHAAVIAIEPYHSYSFEVRPFGGLPTSARRGRDGYIHGATKNPPFDGARIL